ncbi:MAG: hypothetical protein KF833_24285 [Verrucomicrobiae bacterium]|nr:hypothetical protein [Verrucomicrobiae bacterium]
MRTCLLVLLLAVTSIPRGHSALPPSGPLSLTNLVAWCIVPFDTVRRGPEERADMLADLGIRRLAYDWRPEHIPTFDAEVRAMKARNIEITAWWFPASLNAEARAILDCLRRQRISPQLWVTLGTEPEPDPARLARKITEATDLLAGLCAAAAKVGSVVGLYNHLGWFGEPTNQIAILERLGSRGHRNAGIVYNFHHAHAQIDRFPELLRLMAPHLLAVNLNGMVRHGDQRGMKILPLGQGDAERPMLEALLASGWSGPVGLLGHSDEDAEVKLRKELAGLQQLVPQLRPLSPHGAPLPPAEPHSPAPASTPNPRPQPLVPGRFGPALDARVHQILTSGHPEFRSPPLLVEAWVRLDSAEDGNVIVSSELRASPTHWELFTRPGSGELAFYSPGLTPAEVRSGVNVCDGEWHHVAVFQSPNDIRLFVDGRPSVRIPVRRTFRPGAGPAPFAIGRRVDDNGPGCHGLIESVRLTRRPRGGHGFGREAIAADDDAIATWIFTTPEALEGWTPPALAAAPPPPTQSQTPPPVTPPAPTPAPAPSPAPTPDPAPAQAAPINRDEPWKQIESDWIDDRWNRSLPGRWQAYTLPSPAGPVRKGLAVRLGTPPLATVLYDTASGQWRSAWKGGFLRFDPVRFGLLNRPQPDGEPLLTLDEPSGWTGADFLWHGFAVRDDRIVLEYSVGDLLVRESPWAIDDGGAIVLTRDFEFGANTRTTARLTLLTGLPERALSGIAGSTEYHGFRQDDSVTVVALEPQPHLRLVRPEPTTVALEIQPRDLPLRTRLRVFTGAPRQLASSTTLYTAPAAASNLAEVVASARGPAGDPVLVSGQLGPDRGAYAIDTIPIPSENPWNSLVFCSGIGFFANGDAAVSTLHGEVWRVSGLDASLRQVSWRRIAQGLYQPLGLVMVDDRPVVLCRDRLVRLQDVDGDGVTDYYESFSDLIETSPGGHDYATSLSTDDAGNFYYVDPLGAHRISPDGRRKDTLARGFRNPNGMGVSPDGSIVTVAPQQGEWTPSSVLHELRPDGWYGFPGPRPAPGRPLGYDLPLCWIPHRIDNSSGSQIWARDDRFGPLSGHLLHLSWGRCTLLLTLRDVVQGVPQGAVVPLPGRFLSGPMRGAFSPADGQLYVVGSQGWQTSAARDGSLQRFRWTGRSLPLPVAWQARRGALVLTFGQPLDRETAEDPGSYALEAWNYRYTAEYGSNDWSVRNPRREGRDAWPVRTATLQADARVVRLEVPDLQPVMQFGLRFNLDTADGDPAAGEMYGTIHRLHP